MTKIKVSWCKERVIFKLLKTRY